MQTKKVMAFLLALCLMVAVVPGKAFAAGISTYQEINTEGKFQETIINEKTADFKLSKEYYVLYEGEPTTDLPPWYYGGSDLILPTNAESDSVQNVYMDGKALSSSDYTVSEDQCTVTLRANYLQTLPYGKHGIKIDYAKADAECAFYIFFEEWAKVSEGSYTYWHPDGGKDVTVQIDAPVEEFEGIYVDEARSYDEDLGDRANETDRPGFLRSDLYRVESGPDQTTLITIFSKTLDIFAKLGLSDWYFYAVFSDYQAQFKILYAKYGMTEGESVVWNEAQDGDLTLHVDGFVDKDEYHEYHIVTDGYFPVVLNQKVYQFPDGKQLCTFEQEGKVITFHKECLSMLPAGKYDVQFSFLGEYLGFDMYVGGAYIHVILNIVKPTADLTGDGEMDTRDATRLVQHLSNWDAELMGSADFNNDGAVDTRDATRLIQYLSGWEVKLY